MTNTFLIAVMTLIATAAAAPYISPLSAFPAYGAAYSPAYAQPLLSGAVPAPLAAPYSAAYPRADLAAYTLGDYAYGVPNYAPLASAYPVPAAYSYEYVYGR